MIAIALATLQVIVVGIPAARLLDPHATRRRLIGIAYLLGVGIVALLLLAMSILGIRWSLVSVTTAYLAIAAILWAISLRRESKPASLVVRSSLDRLAAAVIDVATLLLIVCHGVLATLTRVGSWDFWAVWGLKARVFLDYGGIDWTFLDHPYNDFAHSDYPLLVPLHDVFVLIFAGQWDDRWLGLLTTLFTAAFLLIVRDCLDEDLPAGTLAALATFGIASLALTEWIGMAEAPLIAYGGAALLMMRRGFLYGDSTSLTTGSVLLGLAAFTKNEGLALIVAVAAAMLLVSWRSVLRLWPAIAIATPWLLLRAVHGRATDLMAGGIGERMTHLSARISELARALAVQSVHHPWFWIAAILALAAFPASLKRERFMAVAVAAQLLFFMVAYLITPLDLTWHVTDTWARLVDQLVVPIGFIAFVSAGQAIVAR